MRRLLLLWLRTVLLILGVMAAAETAQPGHQYWQAAVAGVCLGWFTSLTRP